MPKTLLNDDEREQLEGLLKRRQLHEKCIDLLKAAKDAHSLKSTELSTGSQLTYEKIVDNLVKAVDNKWLSAKQLTSLLSDSEFSGRQHVCVFTVKAKNRKAVAASLRSPVSVSVGSFTLKSFIAVPGTSRAQVLVDTSNRVAVKVLTSRRYWVSDTIEESDDHEIIERNREHERSAVIVSYNASTGVLQIRVPPREKKRQQETSKAVYEFAATALTRHYPDSNKCWMSMMHSVRLSDAFNNIIANTDDFQLWSDSPESKTVKSRLSRKGRPREGEDLRKDPTWKFKSGYSRKSIRGYWTCPSSNSVYAHMNEDDIAVGKTERLCVARVFIPQVCSDEDLTHVIERVLEHL